jgi:hypothetical protein
MNKQLGITLIHYFLVSDINFGNGDPAGRFLLNYGLSLNNSVGGGCPSYECSTTSSIREYSRGQA